MKRRILKVLSLFSVVCFFIPVPCEALKILFVTHQFPKFIQPFILNQITGMLMQGHDVSIYSEKKVDDIIPEEVAKYNLLRRTFYGKLPKNMSFDVIICQFGDDGLKGLALKKKFGLRGRMITCFRGQDLTELVQKNPNMYRELFLRGALFLPVCHAFKDKLIEIGCDPRKIVVLHSAIDCKKFAYSPKDISFTDTINLVTNSRLVEKKGTQYVIQALAILREKYPAIRLTIIGRGKLEDHLKKLVNELDVASCVTFAGWCSQAEVVNILKQAHIFLHPAVTAANGNQEGIPNSLKEAMAMGIPVIATTHSGIPELVEDGVSGYLVPERDSNALAERIEYLILNKGLWKAMGKSGRASVVKKFNKEIENKRLENICRCLVNNNWSELLKLSH